MPIFEALGQIRANRFLKKRAGVPEMGTKPLRALRGHRASYRGSKGLYGGSKGSGKNTRGSKRLGALF